MPRAKTVTGEDFEYTGSLRLGLTVVFDNSDMKITPEIIEVIHQEIMRRSPVLMGANRKPLVPDSIGETLRLEHKVPPQIRSYMLPPFGRKGVLHRQ